MALSRWPTYPTEHHGLHPLRGADLVNAWGLFLWRVQWNVLITLTFDPKRVFPVGQRRAADEAVAWCNDLARALRRDLGWVVAPERTPGGMWHAHVLIVGTDAAMVASLSAAWRIRNGHIDVRAINAKDTEAVVLYTSKETAAAGSAILSDTMRRHLPRAAHGQHRAGDAADVHAQQDAGDDRVIVRLHP